MSEVRRVGPEEFVELFERVKSWGRWGPDDQRGALNYITPEKRAAATASVRKGRTVSLAMILNKVPGLNNPQPAIHMMLRAGDLPDASSAADFIGVAPHGIAVTHIDALCHFFHQGKMYNGYPISKVTSSGALINSIEMMHEGVIGRGVLLDIARLKGVDYLQPGEPVYVEDLEAAEKAQNVRVEEGDILLVRTGRHNRPVEDERRIRDRLAGLYVTCGPWLHERRVAMIGGDAITDVIPSRVENVNTPLHVLSLVAMGVPLVDNCDFEALSRACEEEGRWSFLFIVSPLVIPGGTASPVNPLAVF